MNNERFIKRQPQYQPILDFLLNTVRVDKAELEAAFCSDDVWFDDFAYGITLPELLLLYNQAKEIEREECAKIADYLADQIAAGAEWTALGIIEECADSIRERQDQDVL